MAQSTATAQDKLEKARAAVVRELAGPSVEGISDEKILKVMEACKGDADFAATALTMVPRPEWVAELLA